MKRIHVKVEVFPAAVEATMAAAANRTSASSIDRLGSKKKIKIIGFELICVRPCLIGILYDGQ